MTDEMKAWLEERIAEHKQLAVQALAQANGHSGAQQAYERILKEFAGEAETETIQ